jgi:hypothetical protein
MTIAAIEVHRYMSITNGFDHDMIDAATHAVTPHFTVAYQAYISEHSGHCCRIAALQFCGFSHHEPEIWTIPALICLESLLTKFGPEQQIYTAQLPDHPLTATIRLKKVHLAATRGFCWKGSDG